ncbi:adipokinetic hormone/corazonin-related peptide receptor variant I-like [Homalodisca vitripennis]|uniref:adipokinetic hormone/corazonin-related peptide receptor variant I-like n=1 Tax=Homalodisca vitripennis TaxID=197043 RepID=UPI001EEB4959|nr:adipokinetic hormone/corazonin-related peptide receptor variant I-like [Homalodisca vitripennis]
MEVHPSGAISCSDGGVDIGIVSTGRPCHRDSLHLQHLHRQHLHLQHLQWQGLKVTSVIRLFQGEVSGRVQASSTRVPILCDDCLGLNDSWDNVTGVYRQLPPNLRFNSDSLIVVIVYSILFVVAAVGNLSVFISLVRSRHRKSRMSMVMTHLTIADLIVTFLVIPLEIGWRITVQWIAGNAACKIFLFFRAFGLYLSSNVLVCVSLDRYFAVLHPLKVSDARRRGKVMLAVAWAISFMCSVPQSIVFHVSPHPDNPDFLQCVSFNYFTSNMNEKAYILFGVLAMYFIPLIIIICAYSCILYEILNKTKENRDAMQRPDESESSRRRGRMRLRRSDMSNIERARTRTIKMSVTIVAVFVWCWTPYVFMNMWYIFDRDSAERLDSRLQDGLFIMAVSNSCMNPLVYGSYAIDCRRPCCQCSCLLLSSQHRRQTTGE